MRPPPGTAPVPAGTPGAAGARLDDTGVPEASAAGTRSRRAGHRSAEDPGARASVRQGKADEPTPDRKRLALLAEDRLVGETVWAALVSRGFDAVRVDWPSAGLSVQEHARRLALTRSRVGIIFGDLESLHRRAEARAVVEATPLRWLLVVSDPSDALWGGMVQAGVEGVLPNSVGLDDLALSVTMLLAGQDLLSPGRRREMVQHWRESEQGNVRAAALVARLSVREREIVSLLYEGVTVAEIARQTGVSEQTVRSQVKAVLRKLEVNSQLAAVAVYRRAVERH